jgi:Tol biopolymer transport system component/TolA-binding protein
LFEKALYAEEMKGDLVEAVKLYQQVLKENPGNRQASARALLHIGMCYEKLGSEQARQAYRDVISKYSEQAKEVSMARERITRLEAFTAELTREAEKHMKNGNELFKIWEYESAVKEYENAIKLRPNTSLALNAQYCIGQSWFRAGKYETALATFTKLIEENPESNIAPVTELMVAQVKQTMEKNDNASMMQDYSGENTIVDPGTGITYRKIKSFTGESDIITYTTDLNLSPNGKYLLCANMVVPMDGTAPFELIEFSTTGIQATRGTWSPDGTKAAFFSGDAICVVPVSPETGHTTGPFKKINNDELKYQINPSWSPDGKSLVYQGSKGDLWTLDADGNNLRQITTTSDIREVGPAWSPDGKTILYGIGNRSFGLYDVEKEKFTEFADAGFRCFPVWAPDGKWILLNWKKLHCYNLIDKSKFEFSPPKEAGSFFSWAPGSSKMLFYNSSYNYDQGLKVASASGGPSYEPVHFLVNYGSAVWSDNSKLMAIQGTNEKGDIAFRMVPLAGGESFLLNLDNLVDGTPFPFSISSDLKKLLIGTDRADGKEDVYVVPVSAENARTTGPAIKIFDGLYREGPYNVRLSSSKDGEKVGLIHNGDIWIAFTNGDDPIKVTDTPEKEYYMNWTPDGKAIYFPTLEGWRLLLNPGTENKIIKLTDKGNEIKCEHWNIDFSPDNSKVAILSDEQIKIIPLDESKSGQILDLSELKVSQCGDLRWSPDGKNLAFIGLKKTDDPVSFPDGKYQIYSIPVNGSNPIRIAPDDDDFKSDLSWSPDGKWIAFTPMKPVKVRPDSTIWEADFEEIKEKLAK